jgi:hypothetical protein
MIGFTHDRTGGMRTGLPGMYQQAAIWVVSELSAESSTAGSVCYTKQTNEYRNNQYQDRQSQDMYIGWKN